MSTPSVLLRVLTLTTLALISSPVSLAAGVIPLTFPSIAPFSILAGSAITNSGFSIVSGLIGTSPGTSITGQQITQASGANAEVANTQKAAGAAHNMSTAYLALAAQTCDTVLSGTDLGGLTLAPGVYCFASEALLTGSLALTGPADGIFIFQIASKLTTSTSSAITGEAATNVFWQVGSSATINSLSDFKGTIIAYTSISVLNLATIKGRLMALNGAVTLIGNTITSTGTALSSLTASPAVLAPTFSPSTTFYTATVVSTTSNVTIAANLGDASSVVSGALGVQTLPFGATNFTVVVTSQDELHNTSYVIQITRAADPPQPLGFLRFW